MTLKEKLRYSLTGHLSDDKTEVDVNIAEKIAEEFAIGFALWKQNHVAVSSVDEFFYLGNSNGISFGKPISVEELLKIYKKEKEL
jgi:hypothetical protein